ncbi:M23 family metallopeptidase [Peribacillus acanthi]|uniref:M23 family metallopeptidase n=1 Tax=Peribacillus acanthi TaxID=2171554 RepID=UPI000D3E751C|nr:M23 family metallopeptidase [Peribacillus acanthi]
MIVRITSKFKEISSIHPNPHTGVDIALKEGTPLRSIQDGIIEKVYDGSTNIGKGISVRFEDGTQGIYGHLSDVKVKVGQLVHDGQIIGYSGNTGRSTGEHLHFALQKDGEFIDPTSVVDQTVNSSWWSRFLENGSVANNDYPTLLDVGRNTLEKMFSHGFEHWLSNYMLALPVLVGVSFGVFGLLSMVHRSLATAGVGIVLVMGAIAVI